MDSARARSVVSLAAQNNIRCTQEELLAAIHTTKWVGPTWQLITVIIQRPIHYSLRGRSARRKVGSWSQRFEPSLLMAQEHSIVSVNMAAINRPLFYGIRLISESASCCFASESRCSWGTLQMHCKQISAHLPQWWHLSEVQHAYWKFNQSSFHQPENPRLPFVSELLSLDRSSAGISLGGGGRVLGNWQYRLNVRLPWSPVVWSELSQWSISTEGRIRRHVFARSITWAEINFSSWLQQLLFLSGN